MAALGESQDEVGVLGGSDASDFWFGKGARGPLLASLIFSSSDFMVLRIAFPVFLFSAGRKAEVYTRLCVSQFLHRQLPSKMGFKGEDRECVRQQCPQPTEPSVG